MMKLISKYESELPKIMLDYLYYCSNANQRKSELTIINYALDLKKWFKYQFGGDLTIGESNLAEIELIDLDRYIGSLHDMSANTILRHIASLKGFYTYLVRYSKIINNNIARDIILPKKAKRSPKYLSVKEITKLIKVVEKTSTRFLERDKAIITMFIATGLRLSELTNIKTTDIKDSVLRIIGKNNKERFVPLADKVLIALKDYLKTRGKVDGDYLFTTQSNSKFNATSMGHLVKKYLKRANLDGYSTHKLRHTAASEWYNNGADIKEIQRLLGHSSVSTTEIYVHSNKNNIGIVNNINW